MIKGIYHGLKPFELSDITQARWKELTKMLKKEHRPVYWLSEIPEKRADIMKISLLIDGSNSTLINSGYDVLTASYSYGMEKINKAFIPAAAAESLAFFLLPESLTIHE